MKKSPTISVARDQDAFKQLKQVYAVTLHPSDGGDLWFLGREPAKDRSVAYRFDGTTATRFEMPADMDLPHPDRTLAACRRAWIGVTGGLVSIDGDSATLLKPLAPDLTPRALAATATRTFAIWTHLEGDTRDKIHAFDGETWGLLATPKLGSLRSLHAFGERLIAVDSQSHGYVLAASGKCEASFENYRSVVEVLVGVTRFVTLVDTLLEVRDAKGKQVAKLDYDQLCKVTGKHSNFQCGAHLDADRFLLFANDHGDSSAVGALVVYDATRNKAELHPLTKALKSKSSPSQIARDGAGRLWLNCASWEGKTKIIVIDAKGAMSTIKK